MLVGEALNYKARMFALPPLITQLQVVDVAPTVQALSGC